MEARSQKVLVLAASTQRTLRKWSKTYDRMRVSSLPVISSLPATAGEFKALERALWFDYVVLAADSPWGDEWARRLRYRRLNADDGDAPLLVYQRLR